MAVDSDVSGRGESRLGPQQGFLKADFTADRVVEELPKGALQDADALGDAEDREPEVGYTLGSFIDTARQATECALQDVLRCELG